MRGSLETEPWEHGQVKKTFWFRVDPHSVTRDNVDPGMQATAPITH